ncbi:MAG TPA: hypothetical protein VGD98_20760 [Ktedonobacteraceae bacterium]
MAYQKSAIDGLFSVKNAWLTYCLAKIENFVAVFILTIIDPVKPLVSVVCFFRRVSLYTWMKGGVKNGNNGKISDCCAR